MLHLRIWVGLFILYEAILAEHVVPHRGLYDYISHMTDHTSQTGRFGFSALDELRRKFCPSFCTSADTMSYFMNLLCAIKCPELYLPHHTTTESTTLGTTIIPATPTTTTSQPGQNISPTSHSQGTTAETPSTSISTITTPTTTVTPTTTTPTTTT